MPAFGRADLVARASSAGVVVAGDGPVDRRSLSQRARALGVYPAEGRRIWVRILWDGRNLIDSARLVSGALSGSIASG